MNVQVANQSVFEAALRGKPTVKKRYALISWGIKQKKLIRFSYTDAFGFGSVRTIKPEEIRMYGESICVTGYCYLRKAERVFSLERMTRVRIVKDPGTGYDKERTGQFRSSPKFRKRNFPVVLRDYTDEDGSRYLEAHLTPAGDLEVKGQDLGPGVEKYFGEGFREYEWFYVIKKGDFPKLARTLEAPPGIDILNLLQFRCVGPSGRDIGQVIEEHKIPHEFWNWVGE